MRRAKTSRPSPSVPKGLSLIHIFNEFAGVIGSRVVHQLGMRNRFENAALFEDGDGFGELAGHIKVVGDGDNAHSRFGADSLDGGHDLSLIHISGLGQIKSLLSPGGILAFIEATRESFPLMVSMDFQDALGMEYSDRCV